jgi:hypothetical protein
MLLGGECLEDFTQLGEDEGLPEVLAHGITFPEAARQFLYRFHEQEKVAEAKGRRGPDPIAFLAEETRALGQAALPTVTNFSETPTSQSFGGVQCLAHHFSPRSPEYRGDFRDSLSNMVTEGRKYRLIRCRQRGFLGFAREVSNGHVLPQADLVVTNPQAPVCRMISEMADGYIICDVIDFVRAYPNLLECRPSRLGLRVQE